MLLHCFTCATRQLIVGVPRHSNCLLARPLFRILVAHGKESRTHFSMQPPSAVTATSPAAQASGADAATSSSVSVANNGDAWDAVDSLIVVTAVLSIIGALLIIITFWGSSQIRAKKLRQMLVVLSIFVSVLSIFYTSPPSPAHPSPPAHTHQPMPTHPLTPFNAPPTPAGSLRGTWLPPHDRLA